MDPDATATRADPLLRVLLLTLFAVVVLRAAWVGDDAFITMRTVDHFVHGRGIVYNVGERVQAYTDPLWMFLVSALYWFWREPFWVLVALGTTLSVASVAAFSRWLVPPGAALLLLVFPLSRAFVDYSTSGMENSLTHLLYTGLLATWFVDLPAARRLRQAALLTALMGLTRLDTLLLALPILAAAGWEARREGLSARDWREAAALFLGPLLAWEVFSLVYYGALVPNTALAKLAPGIPAADLAKQGGIYLLFQAEWDPLTLLVVVIGLLVPVVLRDVRGLVVAAGSFLYVAYVVRIGGDFMAGRFLTAPMLAGLALVARFPLPPGERLWGVTAVVVLVGLSGQSPPVLPDTPTPYKGDWDTRGIADERKYYIATGAGIGRVKHTTDDPPQVWRGWAISTPPGAVKEQAAAGYPAFYAHPEVHWVTRYALTDPLLARMPPKRAIDWRAGHFDREIPAGYFDSLRSGSNHIEAPDVAALYDALRPVLDGPLFTRERWREIWRLNTGYYHLDEPKWIYPRAVELDAPGSPLDLSFSLAAKGAATLQVQGGYVTLPAVSHAGAVRLRRREDVRFLVVLERDGEEVGRATAERALPREGKLAWTRVDLPPRAARAGYDTIRVLPVLGPKPWIVQRVAPIEPPPTADGR